MVQDSIHAFAFDLQQNGKASRIKGSPLNYFMGILRQGQPYIPPENYESPRERALRLFVEHKEAIERKQQEMEIKAAEFAFKDWLKTVSETEKQKIFPSVIRRMQADQPKIACLKEYFMKNIWPRQRELL